MEKSGTKFRTSGNTMKKFKKAHAPDEQLCPQVWSWYDSILGFIFGPMSPLKLIGDETFEDSDVVKIHVPDSVEELRESRFYECKSLCRVTFGESSSLKLIEEEAFRRSET